MKQFLYQAKDGPHKTVNGTLAAERIDAVVAQIRRMGYIPMEITPAPVSCASPSRKPSGPPASRRVPFKHTVFFIQNLSDLINAGVPVLRALMLSGRQTSVPQLRDAAERMSEYVRGGGTLSEAMRRCPAVFPQLFANLTRAGEAGGTLSEALLRLAELAQRDLENRQQVLSSLVYPGLILLVGSGTIFGLLTWVVPRLSAIFVDLNESLPVATSVLLAVSGFLGAFWPVLVGGGVLLSLYLRHLFNSGRGRAAFDRMKLMLPVVGGMVHTAEISRFSRTLATLLSNGVGMVNALESTALVLENTLVQQQVNAVAESVRNGMSLHGALKKGAVFPEQVVTMVAAGEEAGAVHQGLCRMADYFERQLQRQVKTVTTLLEPLLIFILGIVVGFVVMAMLLPLLKMNMIIN